MRDLWRPRGGASRLTYRRALNLIESLPPQSRTKTAMRDELDPLLLADLADTPQVGWGPHTYTDDLLCRIGERLDQVIYTIVRANSTGKHTEPAPWRRPGVLSPSEQAQANLVRGAGVVNQLQAEREARAARRQQLNTGTGAPP